MKTQPQNGVGRNFLERLGGASEFTETPHQKQSRHNSDSSNRCKCANDNNSPSNRAINLTAGVDDATDLKSDISAIDLLRRYNNRKKYGYCNYCAMEYLKGFFIKLNHLEEKKKGRRFG